MKSKKIIPITISLLIVLIAAGALTWLITIYNSHKIYNVISFNNATTLNGRVAQSDGLGYLYNEYGGDFEKSELFVLPLSQYNGPDEDYSFYKFNSVYYGISEEALPFNGGNDTIRFLYKYNKVLYLINTEEHTCQEISPEIEFHSASTGGTYLLEINGNQFNFYKRVNYAYDLYPAVTMNLSSESTEFISWINDRYALIKSDTEKGFIYLIADAENGEALTCMSLKNSDEEYKKEIFSMRYFIKELDNDIFSLFDIYTQEVVSFKYKSDKSFSVINVSKNASYVVLKDGNEYKIVSRDGKSLTLDSLENNKSYEFILDNIIFISDENSAAIYKILL